MSERLQQLSEAGVSIWLDDLSRERIETGNLAELIKDKSVVGVTTNPTIFQGAISDGERYDDEVRSLVADGADVDKVVFELTTTDVRAACDVLRPTYDATDGVDGRVSIEVAPALAFDTDATLASARELWAEVDRDNLFVKIPATTEGAPAITDALADGISINVTLIFGLGRYAERHGGLRRRARERARQRQGHLADPLGGVLLRLPRRHRDRQATRRDRDGRGACAARQGRGRQCPAGLPRLPAVLLRGALAEAGRGRRQHPAPPLGFHRRQESGLPRHHVRLGPRVANTVNTMPQKTLEAFADHGEVDGDQVTTNYDDAQQVMDELKAVGIDYDDVIRVLEQEGVDKFSKSWNELTETVTDQMGAATT